MRRARGARIGPRAGLTRQALRRISRLIVATLFPHAEPDQTHLRIGRLSCSQPSRFTNSTLRTVYYPAP